MTEKYKECSLPMPIAGEGDATEVMCNTGEGEKKLSYNPYNFEKKEDGSYIYTVEQGDSLWSITKQLGIRNNTPSEVKAMITFRLGGLNGEDLQFIKPGQKIEIPNSCDGYDILIDGVGYSLANDVMRLQDLADAN